MKLFACSVIFIFLVPYSASVYKGLASVAEVLLGINVDICMIIIAVVAALLLVFGGYLSAEESAQGYSPEINSKPLVEIADDKDIVVVGLANDEVGYIIPLNDYLLDEKQPYAESPRDRLGRRHYEETNSLGPATSQKIADVFADVIRTVNKAKNEFNGSVTV